MYQHEHYVRLNSEAMLTSIFNTPTQADNVHSTATRNKSLSINVMSPLQNLRYTIQIIAANGEGVSLKRSSLYGARPTRTG